jgi:polysaccharide deacetylase family protein (PEP-CTERM system associated)
MQNEIRHIISFDVEEYFQVESASQAGVLCGDWHGYESRVESQVDGILSLLDSSGVKATFFILGWIADLHKSMVRRIADGGHEIASHGMTHCMITRLSRHDFYTELCDSKRMLEDISGKSVKGFRAPTFSIMRSTAWAIDELCRAGYGYDSSIFPVHHDRYGVPDAPRWVHRAVGPDGGSIIEIPPLTRRFLGNNLPVGGGGYFRLFPSWVVSGGVEAAQSGGNVAMIYLHPWEFDAAQPVLPLGRLANFRHRVNLGRTAGRLRNLFGRYAFGTAETHLSCWRDASLLPFEYGVERG